MNIWSIWWSWCISIEIIAPFVGTGISSSSLKASTKTNTKINALSTNNENIKETSSITSLSSSAEESRYYTEHNSERVLVEGGGDKKENIEPEIIKIALLIHGLESSKQTWSTVQKNLWEKMGIPSIAIDILGFGESLSPIEVIKNLHSQNDNSSSSSSSPESHHQE